MVRADRRRKMEEYTLTAEVRVLQHLVNQYIKATQEFCHQLVLQAFASQHCKISYGLCNRS